jgi:hypothetical protein
MVGKIALSGLMVRANQLRPHLGSPTNSGPELTEHALNIVAHSWRLTLRPGAESMHEAFTGRQGRSNALPTNTNSG